MEQPGTQQQALSYEDAFVQLGGQEALQDCEQVRNELQDAVRDEALEQEMQTLFPASASMRMGFSTRLVYQHYVASLDELFCKAEPVQPEFHNSVIVLAAATGGRPVLPPLKSRERAKMKAEFKYAHAGAVAWFRLTDIVRATIIYDTIPAMYGGATAAMRHFPRVLEYNDRYAEPMSGDYRDLQIAVECQGHVCELQLSTALMVQAKQTSGHRSYDVQRELVAAVAHGDTARCESTLLWGLGHLGGSEAKLTQVVNLRTGEGSGTLLHAAARGGHADIIQALLKRRAEVDAQNAHGSTALHFAMQGACERAVWALLDVGKATYSLLDSERLEPLLHGYLALRGRGEDEQATRAICTLAQWAGMEHVRSVRAKINEEVRRRWRRSSALVAAASEGDEKQVLVELRNFAHPDSHDNLGVNALDAALLGKHHGVVRALLDAEANPQKTSCFKQLEQIFGDFFFLAGAGDGSGKSIGICSGAEGRLYCVSHNVSTVLVLEPESVHGAGA